MEGLAPCAAPHRGRGHSSPLSSVNQPWFYVVLCRLMVHAPRVSGLKQRRLLCGQEARGRRAQRDGHRAQSCCSFGALCFHPERASPWQAPPLTATKRRTRSWPVGSEPGGPHLGSGLAPGPCEVETLSPCTDGGHGNGGNGQPANPQGTVTAAGQG